LREANNSLSGPDGRSNFANTADNFYAFEFSADVRARREKILQPTKAERATYAEFLKQPHTGLIRLMPQTARVVTVGKLSKDKLTTPSMFPGGGAFYSFTLLNHAPGDWADLKLKDGNLEVAFGSDVLGALITLGDISLDSLTSDSPGVRVLAHYARPSHRKQAIIEDQRFISGVTVDTVTVKTALPVHEQMTYVLRSIAYGRSDLLVAVRVVKQNEDGSILLLWKRLNKFSIPRLKN